MTASEHPDYQTELERLELTKQYMKIVIKASETTEENFKESMRDALEGIDIKDSSLSYLNMLTNSTLLRRTTEEVKKLKKLYEKPYFARIDFLRKETNLQEMLYLGKTSLFDKETQKPIIVDWRSPIANLYYDGRLGDVTYEAEGEEFEGYLSLKRQYVINQGELLDIRDVDLTTTDELLQKSLAESSSNRLTDIVSTIQEEQNAIIRADLNKPIIVQGAAGSGKTTIALHRISYFIYTYQDYFKPEQLMILAPNRLFIDYISDVLPELGVDNINQTTFVDYVKTCLGKNIKLKHPDELLIQFINHEIENPEQRRFLSSFKGSLQFRDIIDRYVKDILRSLLPKADFYVANFRLYSAKKLRKLMKEEYTYLPLYQRKEKIKRVLQNHVRTEKTKMLKKISDFYDDKLDKALFGKVDPEKRQQYVSKAIDKKEEKLNEIKKACKTAVNQYLKRLPNNDLFFYYEELVTNDVLFKSYAEDVLDEEKLAYFCDYERKMHNENCYEVEDLAALLYLHSKLYGIDKDLRARNVVIDEAQDYSYFQLYALKSALETDMFTIVGDLAQGIHSYRGIHDWKIVQNEIFPRATYKTLQKSYRTTIEIMNAANELLTLLQLELPTVEPVVRHGKKPIFHELPTNKEEIIKRLENMIRELYQERMETIAIIGKTNKECAKLAKLFSNHSTIPIQLLKENEEIKQRDRVVIVSSHLSKGLEFDAVIITSLEEHFEMNEMDMKLLYVSMTRPLHRLFFYGSNPSDFHLQDMIPNKIIEV